MPLKYTPVTTRATPQRPTRQQRPKPIHSRWVHLPRFWTHFSERGQVLRPSAPRAKVCD